MPLIVSGTEFTVRKREFAEAAPCAGIKAGVLSLDESKKSAATRPALSVCLGSQS